MSIRGMNGVEFHDLAGQILHSGHGVRFQARGGSMQPFIQDGDILEVMPLAKQHVNCGDVLLVEAGEGKLLAHRVVKIRSRDGNPAFLIKSEACSVPEGWFGLENVLGRVVVVEHGEQHIQLASRAQQLRSRIWVMISPWVPKFSWLPQRLRYHVRQLLLRGLLPD